MSNKDNINNFFKIIKSIFEFLQVFLFFNAFVSCLYWILVLCDIKIEILDNYFQIALDFVNQFYTFEEKKKDTGVNLSLFIVSVINLLGAFAINYIRDFILSFEAEVNRAKRIAYKREAKKQSEEVKKNYIMEMQKFNKFIYACRVKIARKSNEIFDSEVTEEEVLEIKERIYEDIKGLIQIYNPLRSLGNQDGIIFQINNFKKINEFLQVLSDNKKIMIKKYTKKGIKIKFLEFIDPMTIGQIINESKILKILNLGLEDIIVTTTTFVNVYNILPIKQYKVNTIGLYNLSENINEFKNEELFAIKKIPPKPEEHKSLSDRR